jgi:hypothetical protein
MENKGKNSQIRPVHASPSDTHQAPKFTHEIMSRGQPPRIAPNSSPFFIKNLPYAKKKDNLSVKKMKGKRGTAPLKYQNSTGRPRLRHCLDYVQTGLRQGAPCCRPMGVPKGNLGGPQVRAHPITALLSDVPSRSVCTHCWEHPDRSVPLHLLNIGLPMLSPF